MIRGREGKPLPLAPPSADLLVCFPSRAHLTLMPKPICSPARPSEPTKRHHNSHHHRKKSFSRGGAGGQASPLLWSKTKSMDSEITEPTSPKVTCAGQIKVRPKTTTCRSWQSVMEEIEKIHTDKKQRKRLGWAETLGFKKEIMQFLTCLRSIRFDFRCFGSFSGTDIVTEEEEEEEDDEEEEEEVEEEEENNVGVGENEREASRTVFSKWFMVLQENQKKRREETEEIGNDEEKVSVGVSVPPPNALLLMRCRSAPAKSWVREREGGDVEEEENMEREKEKEKEKGEGMVKKGQSLKSLMEEERRKKEKMVVMRYDSDFYGISSDIAKETWIVGGLRDLMSRSRSSKR